VLTEYFYNATSKKNQVLFLIKLFWSPPIIVNVVVSVFGFTGNRELFLIECSSEYLVPDSYKNRERDKYGCSKFQVQRKIVNWNGRNNGYFVFRERFFSEH
jgi:hypothetical protein